MDISYRGTAYHGWQVQKNAHTVQAEINSALSTLLQTETVCTGSGRTDTGVHALQQIAHFDCERELDAQDFSYRLNAFLPTEIAVNRIHPVTPEAHARFDAEVRSYHYLIHKQKDPFRLELSYQFSAPLDLEAITAGMEVIRHWKNFQAFSKVHTQVNHFACEILDISWKETNEGHVFSVSANRFLRGMVRAMVGTLLEMGQNKLDRNGLIKILESGDRSSAGRAVPPHGLYLTAVKYPINIYR